MHKFYEILLLLLFPLAASAAPAGSAPGLMITQEQLTSHAWCFANKDGFYRTHYYNFGHVYQNDRYSNNGIAMRPPSITGTWRLYLNEQRQTMLQRPGQTNIVVKSANGTLTLLGVGSSAFIPCDAGPIFNHGAFNDTPGPPA